jgi:hypothetical protein
MQDIGISSPKPCKLDTEKPGIGSIRGLNLEVVRPTAIQLTNCSFRVVNNLRQNILHKPSLAGHFCVTCINVT